MSEETKDNVIEINFAASFLRREFGSDRMRINLNDKDIHNYLFCADEVKEWLPHVLETFREGYLPTHYLYGKDIPNEFIMELDFNRIKLLIGKQCNEFWWYVSRNVPNSRNCYSDVTLFSLDPKDWFFLPEEENYRVEGAIIGCAASIVAFVNEKNYRLRVFCPIQNKIEYIDLYQNCAARDTHMCIKLEDIPLWHTNILRASSYEKNGTLPEEPVEYIIMIWYGTMMKSKEDKNG